MQCFQCFVKLNLAVRLSISMLFFFFHQEVWACWRELLSYLDAENKWLNEIELKLKATENIQGGAEEISESLDVSANSNSIILHVLRNFTLHLKQTMNQHYT